MKARNILYGALLIGAGCLGYLGYQNHQLSQENRELEDQIGLLHESDRALKDFERELSQKHQMFTFDFERHIPHDRLGAVSKDELEEWRNLRRNRTGDFLNLMDLVPEQD